MSAVGLLKFGRVDAGKPPSKAPPIPEGVWCLHTSALVPYVRFQGGDSGRLITWGEAIEVSGNTSIVNDSAHAGDVTLAPVVSGVVAPPPRALVLPAELAVLPDNLNSRTQNVDVRRVVRAYLARPNAEFQAGDVFNVRQFANRSTAGTPGGNESGAITYTIALTANAGMVALAPGALQEPAQELRAGAFWDSLRIEALIATWGNTPAYFVLQYT